MGVIDRIVELLAAEDELTELCHTAFAAYDEDESGSMDAKELHAAMKRLSDDCEVDPPSKRKVRQICRRLEGDYEGEVEETDFVEFAKTWLTTYTEDFEEEPEITELSTDEILEILDDEDKLTEFAIDAFVDYDEDDSGSVNSDELHNAITDLAAMLGIEGPSEDEIKILVFMLEFDPEGEISTDDFVEITRGYLQDYCDNHVEWEPDCEALQEWLDDEDKFIADCDVSFNNYDADESGSMDAGELESAFKDLCGEIGIDKPPTKKQLRRIIFLMGTEWTDELTIDDYHNLVRKYVENVIEKYGGGDE